MRRRRRCATAGIIALALAGCSIEIDTEARDIAVDQRGNLTDAVISDQTPPIGGRRIFLVTGDSANSLLRSVPRDVGATPEEILTSLFNGPSTTEQNGGLRSAIPKGTLLLSANFVAQGVLEVNVTRSIFEATGDQLIDAVAQIVFTTHEIDTVAEVVLRVDGAAQRWPRGDGSLDDGPLTIYDYPGRVVTTQPDFPGV